MADKAYISKPIAEELKKRRLKMVVPLKKLPSNDPSSSKVKAKARVEAKLAAQATAHAAALAKVEARAATAVARALAKHKIMQSQTAAKSTVTKKQKPIKVKKVVKRPRLSKQDCMRLKERHIIENLFCRSKKLRRVANRVDRHQSAFEGMGHLAMIVLTHEAIKKCGDCLDAKIAALSLCNSASRVQI
jgi:hypothetical protein